MRLIRQKGLFGISWGAGPDPSEYDFSQAWARGLPVTSSGYPLEFPYEQHPSVAKAISSIAEDAASVEWEVFPKERTDDDDPIEDHPLLTLWDHPNDLLSGNELWIATYTYFKIYGEAFWYYPKVTLGTGRAGLRATSKGTGELLLLHPSRMKVEYDGNTLKYTHREKTEERVLDARFVTHFKRFNPNNPLRGLSELMALWVEMQGDMNAANWNKSYFGDQAGIPAGLAKPPAVGNVNINQVEDFIKRWNNRHAGRKAFGVLPPGWDYEDIGSQPKDMDFRSLREYAREQIFGVEGLPPFLAGILDKANYANAREQKDVYWHHTITRLLTYFQEKLNTDFMLKLGLVDVQVYPRWETVKALTDNLVEKMQVASAMFAIGIPKDLINDRLELGLDVDELEDGDVGYIPFNLMPVGEAGEARSIAGPVGVPSGANGETTNQDEAQAPVRAQKGGEARRAAIWKALVASIGDLEQRFYRMMRAHYNAVEAEVMANLTDSIKGWLLTQRAQKADESNMFDKDASKRKLAKQSEGLYKSAITRGAESVIAQLDLEAAFNPTDPAVLGRLSSLTQRLTRVDDTLERQIRAALTEGLAAGESTDQLAKRIRGVFDAGRARSATIARTETGSAFSWGRYHEMQETGIHRHEWISSRDDKVREDHEAEDGEVVDIGETFPNTNLLYPLDYSGPADQIINCRCVTVPVLEAAS